MCTSPSPKAPSATLAPSPPHYVWKNVAISGGGFVTGIVFIPPSAISFTCAPTSAAAYRRDAASSAWVPLLDWVTAPDWNLHGVESLATDPVEPPAFISPPARIRIPT